MTEVIRFRRGREVLEVPKIPGVIEGNAFLPPRAFIPINYTDLQNTELTVSIGEYVREGQVIARSDGRFSADVHASIPGYFYDVMQFKIADGKSVSAAAIRLEGSFDILGKPAPDFSWRDAPPKEILHIIEKAGLLNTGNPKSISLAYELKAASEREHRRICLNLFDSDPSCSLDSILFKELYEKTACGIGILARALEAESVLCVYKAGEVSREKLDLIASACAESEVDFIKVPDTYPVSELFFLKVFKNAVCIDIPTAVYTFEAVSAKKPVTDVYVLVSGKAVNETKVLKAKIGTPVGSLIEECGGFILPPEHIVINGLVRGFAIDNLDTPVSKFLKSVCVFGKETMKSFTVNECINCGYCFKSCPLYLEPQKVARAIEKNVLTDEIMQLIRLCKVCGCCSACCPARIPLSAMISEAREQLLKGNAL